MLKVMLVDDERLIIEGLKSIIDWRTLGLEVVQTANNGQEAIEKFKENSVDIVVTDINMPKVTGIELLANLKKINDNVKFVVLSGYDEFSYAKSAIELGVKSYILKPVNEDELENVLKSIVEELSMKSKKEEKLLIRNSKMIEFLKGKVKLEDILEFKDVININFESDFYLVSNIILKMDQSDENIDKVIKIIKRYEDGNCEFIKNNNNIIMIKSLAKNLEKNILEEYFLAIKDSISDELDLESFITVGSIVHKIENIDKSYKESSSIKKYLLTYGYGNIIFKEDMSSVEEENKTFREEIEKINKLIVEKKSEKLKQYIAQIFEDEKLTPKNIYDLSIKILILSEDILDEFKLSNNYSRESLSSIIVDLCNENTRDNIKNFLLREIEDFMKVIGDNTNKYSPVVQQVVNIINEEYKEELSLKTLSAKYNINSSYLGQIFSKEVGYSFSEYLNKVKNTKAKELILTTNMKINNIAKEVGYTDTSYFYRKFKKYYGVCPSTLREMKNY